MIKTWQERQNDSFGPWSAKYMQAEIDDLRNCMITDQMLIETANASAERMMIERDRLRQLWVEALAEISEFRTQNERLKKDLETLTLGANNLCKENTELRDAARSVIDRWDTPHWKDVPATAEYIGRLRAALGEKS